MCVYARERKVAVVGAAYFVAIDFCARRQTCYGRKREQRVLFSRSLLPKRTLQTSFMRFRNYGSNLWKPLAQVKSLHRQLLLL